MNLKDALFVHSQLDDLGLDPIPCRVLFHLRRRMDADGKAWPGFTSIAKTCRIDRKSVPNAIKALEAAGILVVERKPRCRNSYRFNPSSSWRVQSGTENGTSSLPPSGTKNGPRLVPKTVPPSGTENGTVRLSSQKVIHKGNPVPDLLLQVTQILQKDDPEFSLEQKYRKAWEQAAQTLIDQGRTPEQILHVFKWSRRDKFWKDVITSLPRLQKHFAKLSAKAGKPPPPPADIGEDYHRDEIERAGYCYPCSRNGARYEVDPDGTCRMCGHKQRPPEREPAEVPTGGNLF